MTFTYDLTTAVGKVRLLLNDVVELDDNDNLVYVFTDEELDAFLALESQSVKRAAAQAIDTNADNEALASKVLRTQDLTTDGAKLADSLRKRAADLRRQADREEEDGDGFFFNVIDLGCATSHVERTQYPNHLGWV